jgi:predicted DNA-binding transcriptional regulator AlpA
MNGEHKPGDGASKGTGDAAPGAMKLERMADLEARVALKKSQLWKLIREGRFPSPIKCGRSSLFVAAEVDAWIAERIRQSRGGAA